MRGWLQANLGTIISLLILTPVGFYSKFYSGPGGEWVNDSLGGSFYVVFWCLVVHLLAPRAAPWKVAVSVLAVTCSLEFMQRWHPGFLEAIRATFLGRTLIGTSFVWSDLGYYVLGAIAGGYWIGKLGERRKDHERVSRNGV
jgi:hypothetical protein